MNRTRLSATVGVVGFTVVALSVVMAFLVDHHWYVTYQTLLLFERMMWWLQLIGIVLAVVGSIGMSAYLTQGVASRVGIAFIAAGLLLALLFGADLLNVHKWTVSLILPVLLLLSSGILLCIVAYLRRCYAYRLITPD
jgi:hypothetical protein